VRTGDRVANGRPLRERFPTRAIVRGGGWERYAAAMVRADALPWFQAALQLLDLRPRDRALVLHGTPEQVRAVANRVGGKGQVTAVHADRAVAEAIATLDLPGVEVLAHVVLGDEQFASFDALLAAPTTTPAWPLGAFGELPRQNLRPGGRYVVDVPGPEMVPELAAAALETGVPAAHLQPLRGIADDTLGDVLRHAGLRSVQTLLGSHLLHLDSPFEAVELFAVALALTPREHEDLARAMVRRCGTTGAVDLLAHRTRVQARR
jgi:hypothetical protein